MDRDPIPNLFLHFCRQNFIINSCYELLAKNSDSETSSRTQPSATPMTSSESDMIQLFLIQLWKKRSQRILHVIRQFKADNALEETSEASSLVHFQTSDIKLFSYEDFESSSCATSNMEAWDADDEMGLTESEMSLTESEISLKEDEMSLTESKMSLTENEMSLTENEMSLTENDMSLTENGMSLKENERSLKENEMNLTESEISLKENEMSLTKTEISLKEIDISLKESQMSLTENDMRLTENEMSLKANEMSLKEYEMSLKKNEMKLTKNEISLKEHEMSLTEGEISSKENKMTFTENETPFSLVPSHSVPPRRKFIYRHIIPVIQETRHRSWFTLDKYGMRIPHNYPIKSRFTGWKYILYSTKKVKKRKPVLIANRSMIKVFYNMGWFGAISKFDITSGKCSFKVLIIENESLLGGRNIRFCLDEMPKINGFRIGFSPLNCPILLGETLNSFAYCESACLANNSNYSDYGMSYGANDVITCTLDLNVKPCTIKYAVNGLDLGVAFTFNKDDVIGKYGLIPHIVSRNYEFQVNFSSEGHRWGRFNEIDLGSTRLIYKLYESRFSNNLVKYDADNGNEKNEETDKKNVNTAE